jgi:hypothetical protein
VVKRFLISLTTSTSCARARQQEEQHGCHSPIGTNDGNTMTTAVAAKDERRRQKKQSNKTVDSTKFLDASRTSVAPATAGISADLLAHEGNENSSNRR